MTREGVVVDGDSSAGQGRTYRPSSPLRPERIDYCCAGRDLPATGLSEMGAGEYSLVADDEVDSVSYCVAVC